MLVMRTTADSEVAGNPLAVDASSCSTLASNTKPDLVVRSEMVAIRAPHEGRSRVKILSFYNSKQTKSILYERNFLRCAIGAGFL